MGPSTGATVPPRDLTARSVHRTDGSLTLYGIQLEWTVGQNSGGSSQPPDWNNGNPSYPHHYEVWLNDGDIKQTVDLYWVTWWGGWNMARTHWVCLGTKPDAEYQVKIRAKLSDGSWSDLTNEVTVRIDGSQPYEPLNTRPEPEASQSTPQHGSTGQPPSRAVRAIRDSDPTPICVAARALNTSTTWQEVVPPAPELIADPPWNGSYLEYRKFFKGTNVASGANPAFVGLDLAADASHGDWPVAILDSSAAEHTFSYAYTAHHVDETWTHQWFITQDGWDPKNGLSFEDLEPVPFLVEIHGDTGVTSYTTEALPEKRGRHAIVNIWGGHGGPDDDSGGKTGEFFVSVSDVLFT
jgi:chitin binding protein